MLTTVFPDTGRSNLGRYGMGLKIRWPKGKCIDGTVGVFLGMRDEGWMDEWMMDGWMDTLFAG